ncbi:MAG TPA: hypothetical protein VG649_25235, partial [Candidatus Angelobacter sp.]|nr:hypothetical protein [Candidatus Angelobacter sp.]
SIGPQNYLVLLGTPALEDNDSGTSLVLFDPLCPAFLKLTNYKITHSEISGLAAPEITTIFSDSCYLSHVVYSRPELHSPF